MNDTYFTRQAADFIREEIRNFGGNEVYFVGKTNDRSVVFEAENVARGNRSSVPVILDAARTGNVVIHNHPSGNVEPSNQDVNLASLFGNKGVGFYIIDNSVEKVYAVVDPFNPAERVKIEDGAAKEYLLPGGAVSGIMGEKYECRDEQLQVLSNVVEAFNDERVAMIEAGTGTGKTLSYLIPSILWYLRNGERVVVSTNTINLQEQLINKDFPLLREVFPEKFDYALVKGMRNYFCILRGNSAGEDLLDFMDDGPSGSMKDVLEWAKKTKDGSLSDLGFTPPDDVWDRVSAESESCPVSRCPHYSDCFFYKSRRELSRAAVIVSNHHVLFSDIAIKGSAGADSDFGILPRYAKLIFDEAHNVAEAATSHFSAKFSKHGLLKTLGKLRTAKSGGTGGLAGRVALLAEKENSQALRTAFSGAANLFPAMAADIEKKGREAFDSLYAFGKDVSDESSSAVSVRLTGTVTGAEEWTAIESGFRKLDGSLVALSRELGNFVKTVEDSPGGDSYISVTAEMNGARNRISHFSEVVGRFFGNAEEGYVRWFEGTRRKAAVFCSVNISPIDVSPHLEDKLYSNIGTVVMTSASLAVDGNFDFQKKSVGLSENDRFKGLIVKSPFDYARQSLLLVPSDIPQPGEKNYEESVAGILRDSFSVTNGNALVLFTSYSSLNGVYEKARNEMEKMESSPVTLLKQGDLPRSSLLEKFRTVGNCVLFATDSFWEGVDIPGDSLRMVVICRLPFKVPTDPVTAAKIEHMEKMKENSFREYMLPLAVLKFKQGFGRLIRSRTDKGVVMVLDNRIVSKYYGKSFIGAVSESGFFCGKTPEVLARLESFFDC